MKKEPRFWEAVLPLLVLMFLLAVNEICFDDTLAGANQIALLLAASVAGIIVRKNGQLWETTSRKIVNTIGSAMPSMLILLLIGALAGTWLISGIVPVMIYYGLDLINPHFFFLTALLVASVVSMVTGSSWSTIATIGIALLGIGKAIGVDERIAAGAIISGAYFGDKMSPLSDTTNLAPAMAGTDLFTHIRYMLYTTVPSYLLSMILFLILGYSNHYTTSLENVAQVKEAIDGVFYITPWLFAVPLLLLTIIMLKVPAIPSLFIGTLLGGLFAVIFQPQVIGLVADHTGSYVRESYVGFMQAMFGKVSIHTPNTIVNGLLSTTGMGGMLNTIWLILSAMVFGGIMEAGGLLERLTRPIVKRAKSTGSLVSSTVVSCIFFNATASDQYISIVVPGRMFRKSYEDKGYKPELLSRTLEDAGTMSSVLIPWNTGGATQARVLGVPTIDYLPYCFFNLISPLMSILFAYLNIKIRRIKKTASE